MPGFQAVLGRVASVLRYFIIFVVDYLSVWLKYLLFGILTFAAWIRSFSECNSIGMWAAIAAVLFFLVYSYYHRPCQFPIEGCKIENNKPNEFAKQCFKEKEEAQRALNDIIKKIMKTEESRRKLIDQFDNINERWKEHLIATEKKENALREELFEITDHKYTLEERLQEKIEENDNEKMNYEENLKIISDKIQRIKQNEEAKQELQELVMEDEIQKMEDENILLRDTLELLAKQQEALAEKHAETLEDMKVMADHNRELEEKMMLKLKQDMEEQERQKNVKVLTEKLLSSLTQAKGRLSKVKHELASDSPRATTLAGVQKEAPLSKT